MQVIFVILASLLGLSYSHFFGGFDFYTQICLFAGIFLITPALFQFNFSDLKSLNHHKIIVVKNIILNFLLLPIIAISIGLFFNDFGIAGALLLLSLFPSGGMVMNWIKKSNANIKLGFSLFALNISLLVISFNLFDVFSKHTAILNWYQVSSEIVAINIVPFGAFMILVVIPFILSRVLLQFAPSTVIFIQNKGNIISNIAIFIIVFYLFSLKSFANIVDIELSIIIKAILATSIFYILTHLLANFFYKNDKNDNAGYWHTTTRFITISLAISTFAVPTYGYSFILPIMIAYFIQIPLSSKFANIRKIT